MQLNFSLILHIVEIAISSEFFATDIWVFFLVVWVGGFGVGGGVFGWFLGGGVFVLVGFFFFSGLRAAFHCHCAMICSHSHAGRLPVH